MKNKLVLDTSILIKFFTKEKGFEKTEAILTKIENNKAVIFLPELAKYELGNALLKGKNYSLDKAKKYLKVFFKLPIIFSAEDYTLAVLTYKYACQLKITYYDACFLALAKKEKAVLLTANPKHHRQVKGIRVDYL